MRLAHLIDGKQSSIHFSWNGSCECFEKFNGPIIDEITKQTVTWTNNDGYPIGLKLHLKFVKFNHALVLASNGGVPPRSSTIAFIQIYFFNASSVEEYRQILPDFAEWVNQSKAGQWLVVFDSTRAREQKTRNQILEKVKSDVGGHQNRIFELNGLSDTKSMITLVNSITSSFTASLDQYRSALKSVITTLSEDCSIPTLINSQINLSFFYWSIGMMEDALKEIEDLDSKITRIFGEAVSSQDDKICAVLNSLKSIDGRDECPLLERQMERNEVEPSDSLISLRSFILAHQFLAGSFSYETRKLNADALTVNSLNNYFASTLFKSTYNLLIWLKQNLFSPRSSVYDQVYQNCLQIVWTHEAFEFSKCYGDHLSLEATAEYATKLRMLNSEAWLFLLGGQKLEHLSWLSKWKADASEFGTSQLVTDIREGRHFEYCKKSLESTVKSLKSAKWSRNFIVFRLYLAKLMIGSREELLNAIDEILNVLPDADFPVSLLYLQIKKCVGDPAKVLESSPKLLAKFNSHLCNVILRSKEPVITKRPPFKLFNFDVGNSGESRFPFRIKSIHPPFIVVQMNKPFCLSVNLHSDHDVPLVGCRIETIFKPLTSESVYFNTPSFECVSQQNAPICRLLCVDDGSERKAIEPRIAIPDLYTKNKDDLVCEFVGDQECLRVGPNCLEFKATPDVSSNMVLSYLSIVHPSGFEFVLSMEYEKLISEISGCFCFVDIKAASVELSPDDAKKTLYAGMTQEVNLCLQAGSMAIPERSNLKANFLDAEDGVEFLNEDGTWSKELIRELPAFEAMSECLMKIRFCTTIHQMNYSVVENFSFPKQLKVEWQGQEWTFQLLFTSILSIKTMTSVLEDKTLFEADIQNCYANDQFLIVPLEAAMSSIDEDNAENSFPAELLNEFFEPICADSTCRLVWRLSSLTTSTPFNHNIRIRYKIQPDEADSNTSLQDEIQQIICSREYTFEDTISFAIPRIEYEICARILSEQPQSSICRAGSSCDFVISLRMLAKNNAETVIVALEADPEHWTIVADKFKVVHIKENGLGQTTFSLIPRAGFFLPYPSVYIHRLNKNENANERDLASSLNESKLFGERVAAFNRTEAKQIHVLGAFNSSEDTDSLNSNSGGVKSFRVQAKERIQRLFES